MPLRLQRKGVCFMIRSLTSMVAKDGGRTFPQKPITSNSTHHHIPEDGRLHIHVLETLMSCTCLTSLVSNYQSLIRHPICGSIWIMWKEQVYWWTVIFQIVERYEEGMVIKVVQSPDTVTLSNNGTHSSSALGYESVSLTQPSHCNVQPMRKRLHTDWLTDCVWSHSPFNPDDEDRDCQNVGFLLNSDMADHSREF
jgi:hypothetical protein